MSNKYDDIDYCLSLLYDYAYNQERDSCLLLDYHSKRDVDINLLKKGDNFKVENIMKSNINLLYEYDGRLYCEREKGEVFKTFLKIGKYTNSPKAINHKELCDMKASYILSEIALSNYDKFILLPIMNFDIEMNKLINVNKSLGNEIKKTMGNVDLVYVQVYENYDKMIRMDNFIRNTKLDISDIKNIVMQVILALYKIQLAYPSFRHNKLGIESLYVTMKKREDERIKIKSQTMNLPKTEFIIKITDFYDCHIDEFINNLDTKLKSYNPFYDIHYFLTSLYKILKETDQLHPTFKNFYDSVIPSNIATYDKDKIGMDESYYKDTITDILDPYLIITKNNFFTDLISKNTLSMLSPVSNSPMNIKSVGGSSESSVQYGSLSDSSDVPKILARKEVKPKSGPKDGKIISGSRQLKRTGDRKTHKPTVTKHENRKKVSESDESDVMSETSMYNDSLLEQDMSDTSLTDASQLPEMYKKGKKNNIFSAIESMGGNKMGGNSYQMMGQQQRKTKAQYKDNNTMGIPQNIAGDIPEGYEGMLPEWVQSKLPIPGGNGNGMGMNNSVFLPSNAGMPQGMMAPNMMHQGMMPQGMMAPNMMPQGMAPNMINNSIDFGSMGLPSELGPLSTENHLSQGYPQMPQFMGQPGLQQQMFQNQAANPFAQLMGQAGGGDDDELRSDFMDRFFF